MFFFGSMNLRDKRVERILTSRGFKHADIYYSPIAGWICCLFMLLGVTFPILLQLGLLTFYPVFIVYLVAGYLVAGRFNNSFAITENQIHIINPNFPFRTFKSFSLNEIDLVTIDKTKWKWHYLFCVLGNNYVEIKTGTDTEKYFCAGLELDAFDENWTKNTIDTFDYTRRQKGVQVEFKLDSL